LQPDEEEEDEYSAEERIKMVVEQFAYIYQNDPALRKLLGAEVDNYSIEDKLEIVTSYM